MLFEEGGGTNGIALAYRNTPDTLAYYATENSNVTQMDSNSTFAEDDSVWIHVGVVYDHGLMKLYINGELDVMMDQGVSAIPAHTDDPGIGDFNSAHPIGGSPKPWDGCLDEFKLFNRALNDAEIKAIYREGL